MADSVEVLAEFWNTTNPTNSGCSEKCSEDLGHFLGQQELSGAPNIEMCRVCRVD